MKNLFFTILFTALFGNVFSQGRVVLNNDGFIVIDNSAFFVIDNGAANAITLTGSGGKIISEAEDDVIKWNVGTSTGVHIIPWATSVATGAVKIPLSISITAAGVGAGNILLSTHETTTDMNTPWQSGISNMCSSVTNLDGSLFVVDRFWQINANGYGTKPTVNMTMGYNPAANEIAGTNTIVETNLEAQRFNAGVVASGPCFVGAGSWETTLFGTNNAASDNVTNIVVAPADFYKDWILTDRLAPLPVELLTFDATCNGEGTIINWVTAVEINNDYFVVEKSYDATVFFDLTTVNGAGNSNNQNNYSVIDNDATGALVYYRLKQVDFDGTTKYYDIIAINCGSDNFEVTNFVMGTNQLDFKINTSVDEALQIFLYDYRGRLIVNKKSQINKGINNIEIPSLDLSTGIYMLSIIGETNSFSTKLMKK
jgi:hypothetical protein